jgi:hypothetical protein
MQKHKINMDRLLEVNPEAGKKLYSLLFHYNCYTEKWACFRREDKVNYFNGSDSLYPIGIGETTKEAYDEHSYRQEE